MNVADEKKTRQIFTDLIAPHLVTQASDIKQTNIALFKIEQHLEKINNKIEDHDKIITENLPHTVAHCSQIETIKKIRDNMISRKAIVSAIIIAIPLAGIIIGMISHFLK